MSPIVRYFCHTDEEGAAADLSIAYVRAFLTLGLRVRLLSGSGQVELGTDRDGKPAGRWAAYRELFMTPMTSPFVNVVCGDQKAAGRFYTVGVRNILITADGPADAKHVAVVQQYQGLLVPTTDLGTAWRLAGGHPLVVTLEDLALASRLRQVLLE
jgi:hypothetical protein